MPETFEQYFEEASFETDVLLIGSKDHAYGSECLQYYENPDNSEDHGFYARFVALLDEKGKLLTWHNKPGVYWKEESSGVVYGCCASYQAPGTYRMVVSRAKKGVPKEFKGSFLIRESKGKIENNPLLAPAARRYHMDPLEFESPLGTFYLSPWLDKFVLELDEAPEEYYRGPCVICLECDKDNHQSCSVAHENAMQYFENYDDWYFRLVNSAVKNLLKKEVDWLVSNEEYQRMIDYDEGEWMHCTYANRVFDKTYFESLDFTNDGSFTAEMCCSVVDIDGYFTMTGSVTTNRVKKLVKW